MIYCRQVWERNFARKYFVKNIFIMKVSPSTIYLSIYPSIYLCNVYNIFLHTCIIYASILLRNWVCTTNIFATDGATFDISNLDFLIEQFTTSLGCKDVGIRTFVGKTQFLYLSIHVCINLWIMDPYFYLSIYLSECLYPYLEYFYLIAA